MNENRNYQDYLDQQDKIDSLISHLGINSILLGTLMRLRDKVDQARKEGTRDEFMKSEFAGIGVEMLADKGLVYQNFAVFDWHPSGTEGTYIYDLTPEGRKAAETAMGILGVSGIDFYY